MADAMNEKTKAREDAEQKDVLDQAAAIQGYDEWKRNVDLALKEKKERDKAFDLVFQMLHKFRSMSLYQLSFLLDCDKRMASKMVLEWRSKGRVILMTEQTRGHRYIIKVKA